MNELQELFIRLGIDFDEIGIDMANNCITINLSEKDILYIEPCPRYSNRGRYLVKAFTGVGPFWIDGADRFPRYYFDPECLALEMKAWADRRIALDIGADISWQDFDGSRKMEIKKGKSEGS